MGRLWDMLTGTAAPSAAGKGRHDDHDLHLAAAALLVELASVDRKFQSGERTRIHSYVRDRLGLAAEEAQVLIDLAEHKAQNATQLHRFTQLVKNGFSYEERVHLVEALWEVVYSDAEADAYESQLMRRIAGLIYVTDRDSGLARRRALERHQEDGKTPGRVAPKAR